MSASACAEAQPTSQPTGCAPAPGRYRQRRPEQTLYYKVVQQNLQTWLAVRREADPDSEPIPAYVEAAFLKFLGCGIYACGFARLRCGSCGYEALLPFSCRVRGGVCPSCASRYTALSGAWLTDQVLPRVPFRQVVLTVPKRVRFFLAEPTHERSIRRIFLRALEATIHAACPSAPPDARIGAVTFTHRAGASLNKHHHFHSVATDGTFALDDQGHLVFFQANLTEQDFATLTETIRRRVLAYLVRHDLLDPDDAQNMLSWQGSGGFSVHGAVTIERDDREGLERIIRYCARSPWASSRLRRIDDETLLYELPPGDVHGRDHILLSPLELLDRLAFFIPPPRRHRHTYYGLFAPNAALRPLVSASAGPDPKLAIRLNEAARKMGLAEELGFDSPAPATSSEHEPSQEPSPADHEAAPCSGEAHAEDTLGELQPPPGRAHRPASRASVIWAMLMARIFEVLPLTCPRCSQPMRIIAFISEPSTVRRILIHLHLPTTPPPLSPARGPPDPELPFGPADHDPGFDDYMVDEDPGFEVDQTHW